MFRTLKGNKTRPCDCVCLENGVWVALGGWRNPGMLRGPSLPAGYAWLPPGVYAGSLQSLAQGGAIPD